MLTMPGVLCKGFKYETIRCSISTCSSAIIEETYMDDLLSRANFKRQRNEITQYIHEKGRIFYGKVEQ